MYVCLSTVFVMPLSTAPAPAAKKQDDARLLTAIVAGRTKSRRQRTEDGGQKTESKGQQQAAARDSWDRDGLGGLASLNC